VDREAPTYPSTAFLADVGGAAGLIFGLNIMETGFLSNEVSFGICFSGLQIVIHIIWNRQISINSIVAYGSEHDFLARFSFYSRTKEKGFHNFVIMNIGMTKNISTEDRNWQKSRGWRK